MNFRKSFTKLNNITQLQLIVAIFIKINNVIGNKCIYTYIHTNPHFNSFKSKVALNHQWL